MKRALPIIGHVALAASALLFALSVYQFGDWNWRPVEEPYPGPGFTVSANFRITNAGKYRVEVLVPVKIDKSESGMAEQPPIPCNALLSIRGPEGFHAEQRISELRHAGRYYFGKTDTYVAEPVDLVTTGAYQVDISNAGAPGPLSDRGGMLQFTRFEHPTESFLAGALVRGAGWLFLAVGLVSAIASWRRSE